MRFRTAHADRFFDNLGMQGFDRKLHFLNRNPGVALSARISVNAKITANAGEMATVRALRAFAPALAVA